MGAMQPTLIITGIGVGVALASLAVTLVVLLFKGSFQLGALVQKVDGIDNNVATMIESINGLREEAQRSNGNVIALANHHHDTDGNTTFAIPLS